ncbi:MAG: hypothetical protein KF847_15310 [Pirellulales bacterium]|nr:hypothetical protein [Pirellulales bacterium]
MSLPVCGESGLNMTKQWAICGAMCVAAAVLASGPTAARAQTSGAAAAAGVSPVTHAPRPGVYQRLSGASNPALEYYGRGRAQFRPAPKSAAVAPAAAQAVQTAPASKPFTDYRAGSNLSPYLALDIQESSVGLPSYYAFVQPQLEQQRFAQRQQMQNQRTQQQLRSATAAGAINRGVNGGLPTTGHSTQYFNMGGYYPTTTK